MARVSARLEENAPGSYFVDDSCIDCAMCRWLAPRTFARDDGIGLSVVKTQPEGDREELRAAMALVSCPTSSIGSDSKEAAKRAVAFLPDLVEDGVYFCGYASESSYGASSYLVTRPGGNVLVDSPRAAKPLLARIEALGGVRQMFLTHRDDVADHEVFAKRFGCERVMHDLDAGPLRGVVERLLEGQEDIPLAPDLLAIPLPGHTRGSMALLYRNKYLFTGDHLWGTRRGAARSAEPVEEAERGILGASRSVAWYSWAEQTRSMERLLAYDFAWVLPGHGMPLKKPSAEAMREELRALVARMK